ncbi:MAG TPA: ISAs1 family transposase [Thermomicrobiales bacterium]
MDNSTRVPPLAVYLATIPEFRASRGKRHGLLPLLLLVCVAMLCGARGQSAIAAWGRDYGRPWLRRLGFTRGYGPSQATLHRLFAGVAYPAVEAALGRWAEQALRAFPPAPGTPEGVALDGKTLRGSRKRGAADAHLLAALSHRRGVVVGQVAVADKTNEIGAAGELLLTLALDGRVLTADALLTQRTVAQAIVARGGDDLLAVKENQPTLLWEVAAAFDVPAAAPQATEAHSQHGGRVETRRLAASTALVGYSDWPGLAQALRLERRVVAKATGAVLRQEVVYAVTSLAPERATPAQLLTLWRAHWHIENKLHYVRDVTFDEDRAQVRAGTAPQCMAAFRNLAIGLLRLLGAPNIAAAIRRYAAQPARALAALGLTADFE